jgi:hypothetical protein
MPPTGVTCQMTSRIDIVGANGNDGLHYRYNCKKVAYYGESVQWDGSNLLKMQELCSGLVCRLLKYDDLLMVRLNNEIFTLKVGDWMVKGENGEVKHYTNEIYHIKYQGI